MEFTEVVNKRKTYREFEVKEVPKEIVEGALEIGMKAPTYNHLKEWNFILVKDKAIRYAITQTEEMVESISDEIREAFRGFDEIAKSMYFDAIPRQRKMIIDAPEVLVVVYKPKTKVTESRRIYDLNGLASVWCCIENILLSLAENDVYGVTFVPKNTGLVKSELNIPDELEVAAIIPFGYKAPSSKVIKSKEIDLKTLLHIDRWG